MFKNIKYSITILSIALVTTFALTATIFTSCKKDTSETTKTENKPFTVETDNMNAYLSDFKTRLQSNLKSGETLETEEAMWHLTALLNFDYGDAGHEFSEFTTDTSYMVIGKTGDGVSYEELNSAYTDLQNFVETVYETSDLDGKKVYVVVAKVVSENDETMTIQTTSTLGSRFPSPGITFGPTDYWWEYNGGKCGPYLGQYLDRGAPSELTRLTNLNLGVIVDINGGRVYFTDIQAYYIDGYESDEDSNSPQGRRVFYNETYSVSGAICLSPDDMNYYLGSYIALGNQHKPTGKHITKFTVEWGALISYVYFSCHVLMVEYGKANVVGGGGAIN